MDEYRVVHGIKLFKRTCPMCKSEESAFWVPRSSLQTYCCAECETDGNEGKKRRVTYRKKKAPRNVEYQLLEDDYE